MTSVRWLQVYVRTLQFPTPDVPEVLDVVIARRLNYLVTSIGTVCGNRRRRYKMPPKRTRAQRSGKNSNTESTTKGLENPTLTPAQIAELVATTVAQILASQPAPQPQPNLDQRAEEMRRMREELENQQAEEMRKMREELENLKKERSSVPPPPPAREVPFSIEVLEADLPQHFKYPN
ncbi:DNA binding protein [Dorcoceras hygrometricum]|uniref:DNA binding protein n=1 Tax=Dorcoceras hygrometricum TaxID=472368 RepID=A0A2Z7D6Z3_9LAMI|nr:DNA binding protein [Dorcoceras hygrometricum]